MNTLVRSCWLCVGGCLCVYVIKLALKSSFLHVLFLKFSISLILCVSMCFRVIMVRRLFLEWLSLFVVEATFLPKSKLSWRNCL